MKSLFLSFTLLLSLCCTAQSPTPADFIKAKQNPEWVFKPGFSSDSMLFTNLSFYQQDSLLLVWEERLKPLKTWYYKIYTLSAKTGKIVREDTTNFSYSIFPDSLMIGQLDSLVTRRDIYTGKTIWSLDIDKILTSPNKQANRTFYWIYNMQVSGKLLYIQAFPSYVIKPSVNPGGKERKAWVDDKDATYKKSRALLVVDLNTGKIVTKKACPYRFYSICNDTLIGADERLTCTDFKTGKKLWSHCMDLPGEESVADSIFYFPVEPRDKLYRLFYKFVCMQPGKPDSIYLVQLNKKTGKTQEEIFVGMSGYMSTGMNTDDSTTYLCWQDSLTAYSTQPLQKKWSIPQPVLKGYNLSARDEMAQLIKTDEKKIFIADTSSSITCINKDSGKILWNKNYHHSVNSPMFDFALTLDFVILTVQDVHGGYVGYNETYVIDKNNPANKAADGTTFSILGEDAKTGDVYIYEDKNNKLKKIKIH